jgi:hypothetical protein
LYIPVLSEHIDFTWQTEAGERDGKVDILLAVVATLVLAQLSEGVEHPQHAS